MTNPRQAEWQPTPKLLEWLYSLETYNNQTNGRPKEGRVLEMPKR